MTDVVEKIDAIYAPQLGPRLRIMERRVGGDVVDIADLVGDDAEAVWRLLQHRSKATLTLGSTWTTDGGVEVMVVPVEATEAMIRAFNEEYDHELGERLRSAWLAMLSAIRK